MKRNTTSTPADEGIAAASARHTKETASQAVERLAKDARSLLIRLQEKVDDIQHNADDDPRNWGYAGDLGHIRAEVLDVLIGLECGQFDGNEDRTRDAILASL